MTLAARYNRLACALVMLGVAAYATAAGSMLVLLCLPVIAAAWYARVKHGWMLPRLAVNILLTGVIGVAVYRVLGGPVSVDTIAELVLLILLVKLWDRRTPKDDGQLLSMAVFMGIAAMLTSIDLVVGAEIVVMIPLLAASVMLFQVYAGRGDGPGAASALPRGFMRHVRSLVALTVMCTAVVGLSVFVLMPRGIGRDRFGNWGMTYARNVSGFTDTVTLTGGGGVISQSPEVVLTLQVRTSAGVSLGGEQTIHYLRGAVLERYEGGVWSAAPEPSVTTIDAVAGNTLLLTDEPIRVTVDQTIVLRGLGPQPDYLFAEWRPVRLQYHSAARHVPPNAARVLRAGAKEPGRFEYTVSSSLGIDDEPGERSPVRPVEGPIADLARRVLRNAGIDPDPAARPLGQDMDAARSLQDYLRNNFRYTLETEAAPAGRDPVEWFLFERKAGHCELYAAAMTLMCRDVGINARLVTGYVAVEYNAPADQYVVRASNAHAWVEAELGRGRWRRFDPTPSDELARIHRPAMGLLTRLRNWLDAMKFAWERSVVSFDEATRARVIGADRDDAEGLFPAVDRFLARVRAGGPRLLGTALGAGAMVFVVCAATGSGLVLLAHMMRRRGTLARRSRGVRGREAELAQRLTQVRFYDHMLEALTKQGRGKPAWRPPLDFAGSVDDARQAAAVRSIASLYYAVRFGGSDLDDAQRRDAEAALAVIVKG
ncbi:MAG: DUF3488 domain-containing protein [Phycisphaerales bacterium]|nr:DUF3488 domain-containing protein [Phycisphaerales bacterium]